MSKFTVAKNLERTVAVNPFVSADIRRRGVAALAAAKAKLLTRRSKDTTHSRVSGRKVREDYLLYLDDTSSDFRAHLIEFGFLPSPARPKGQVPVRAITGPEARIAAGGQTSAY